MIVYRFTQLFLGILTGIGMKSIWMAEQTSALQ
jgi:hypothetical protein